MGRKRIASVALPEGVQRVTARGRTYYYWNPGRGTAREGKRIRLPNVETEPAAFWKEIELYRPKASAPEGSVSFLVQKYCASGVFKRLSNSTKASYGIHLNRFERAWGKLSFELPDGVVIALRDALAETPGMVNHMLSVGRTLWNWGRSIGVRSNPFVYISNLDVADTGHVPWPAWAMELVCTTASARSRSHGTARRSDLSAGIRSHPHGPSAARAAGPVVPPAENEKEAQGVLRSTDASRRTHARSLGS